MHISFSIFLHSCTLPVGIWAISNTNKASVISCFNYILQTCALDKKIRSFLQTEIRKTGKNYKQQTYMRPKALCRLYNSFALDSTVNKAIKNEQSTFGVWKFCIVNLNVLELRRGFLPQGGSLLQPPHWRKWHLFNYNLAGAPYRTRDENLHITNFSIVCNVCTMWSWV